MGRFGDWSASRLSQSVQSVPSGDFNSSAKPSKPAARPPHVPAPFEIAQDGEWTALEQVEWFRVLTKQAIVRSEPDEKASIVGNLKKGQTFQVRPASAYDGGGRRWVELTPFELWRSFGSRADHAADQKRGFAPISEYSDTVGECILLQDLMSEEESRLLHTQQRWRPPRSVHAGAKLCRWMAHVLPAAWTPSPAQDQNCLAAERPMLGIGTMLKGAPPNDVLHWILYHLKLQFHRIYLYFDDPTDPAIQIARRFVSKRETEAGVAIRIMDQVWWRDARRRSRFFKHSQQEWSAKVLRWMEEFQDVTARQQICIDLAAQDAEAAGLDWLLHIDIDELFYIPHASFREDAPSWFARVPDKCNLLRFSNHECVPEGLEVTDWFRDVSLFKVNIDFLRPREEELSYEEFCHKMRTGFVTRELITQLVRRQGGKEFHSGTKIIVSLSVEANGDDLQGQKGVILNRCIEENSWQVQLDNGKRRSIKENDLIPYDEATAIVKGHLQLWGMTVLAAKEFITNSSAHAAVKQTIAKIIGMNAEQIDATMEDVPFRLQKGTLGKLASIKVEYEVCEPHSYADAENLSQVLVEMPGEALTTALVEELKPLGVAEAASLLAGSLVAEPLLVPPTRETASRELAATSQTSVQAARDTEARTDAKSPSVCANASQLVEIPKERRSPKFDGPIRSYGELVASCTSEDLALDQIHSRWSIKDKVCEQDSGVQEPQSEAMMLDVLNTLRLSRAKKAEQWGISARHLLGPAKCTSDEEVRRGFFNNFTHFLGYTEGKSAVRLHIGMQAPMPSFVTSFCTLDSRGNVCIMKPRHADGDADPVVLHYANCGFSYWAQKYAILGDFPNDKGGGAALFAHLAARDLVKTGDLDKVEKFYRLFVLGNELGEQSTLEDLGVLVRVRGVRQIINAALKEHAEQHTLIA